MIEARFSPQMKEILKKLKGEEFISYGSKEISVDGSAYNGAINLQTSNVTLRISNEGKQIPWFKGETKEEVFSFSCEKIDVLKDGKVIFVKEKIDEVSLIYDTITIPEKNYQIVFDMALIIKTEKHLYLISREWHFLECLNINLDKDYDDIYPIKKVMEDWNNFGNWQVDVDRKVERL